MQRLRLLEWIVIMIGVWLVWGRVAGRRQPVVSAAPTPWIIDICAILAIGGVVGGALTGWRWLALLGFGSAALGLALSLKYGLRRIGRWIRGWWRIGK